MTDPEGLWEIEEEALDLLMGTVEIIESSNE